MKKVLFITIICLVSSIAFIACEKQSIDKEEVSKQKHTQKEISTFMSKIEERGDNSEGEIIIYTNGKKSSKVTYVSKKSEYFDILGPIVQKLETNGVVTTNAEDEEDGKHGSADCKYCSALGGMSCGRSIASQIPKDAEEVQVTISKKDKNGCRNIHAEW